jgi:alanine racemase
MRLTDPVARIDLGAIVRNAARLRHRANNRPLLAAVKADGYGHGAVAVARALEHSGVVNWFGVATAKEALQLRNAGITGRILVFGPVPGTAEAIRPLLAHGVDLTITDQGDVAQILQAVEMERAQQKQKEQCENGGGNMSTRPNARVHLKTDTV